MLAYLAYFQFAFLYLLVVAIGLVVYGSDFKGIAGWIYIIPLLVLTVAHHWVWPLRQQLSSAKGIRIVCGTGAVVALLAYSPMHMGYWDEHSLWQAVLMAGLGICSYLLSIIAAAKITPVTTTPQTTSYRNSPVWVLALIGLFWLLAKQYPLVVLLCLALVFIISAFWLPPPEQTGGVKLPAKSRSDPFAKYTIFLTAIDLSCVVWDFEIDTRWAWYVAVGFLAAAVGYYVGRGDNKSDQLEQGVYFAAIVNFVAAALWSPYIVWFLHVGIAS